TLFAAGVFAPLPSVAQAAPSGAYAGLAHRPAHTSLRVVSSATRWQGGLMVTRLTLDTHDSNRHVDVEIYGGSRDGLTQIVSHYPTPRVGDEPQARNDDDRLVIEQLPPLHEESRIITEEMP